MLFLSWAGRGQISSPSKPSWFWHFASPERVKRAEMGVVMSALRKIWADCAEPLVQKIFCLVIALVYALMIVLTALRMFVHDGDAGWGLQTVLISTWVLSTALQWSAGTIKYAPNLLRDLFSSRGICLVLFGKSQQADRTALALLCVLVPMAVLMLIVIAERIFGEYSIWGAWVVKTLLNLTYPAYNLCALRASLNRQRRSKLATAPAQGALIAINSFMVLLTLLLAMETMPTVDA